ncbi:hypothetical protein [Microcella alkalica]|uniref:Transcriptional regulator, AbiEi antitoxin, Type IV TA system n=1 Tax=Microcella alkalica TaxID=355930 RepID=A0A839EET2_9MICO|nr:hypothetical protein [Microcella alkalica]MBA8848319.1 hypothetical protein [Microcella alkalica]MBA8848902.1 hypothetical protein [Microcella alkalica]
MFLPEEMRQSLTLISEVVDRGERAVTYRALASGSMRRLHPGVHIAASRLKELSQDDRYLLRVVAVGSRLHRLDVLSHWSAAALWGLPSVDSWPAAVHSTVPAASMLASTRSLRRHRARRGPGALRERLGLPVTSLARTVVDVAATSPFPAGVALADAALFAVAHGAHAGQTVTSLRAELEDELEELATGPGSARARRVIGFADERADRPGESLSRATMHLLGAPAPELQFAVVGVSGQTWHTDFGWPEFGAVAEFDGRAKYSDARYLAGRTPAQAVYDEKLREDDIRPRVRAFGRWDWRTSRSRDLMRSAIMRLGVPCDGS